MNIHATTRTGDVLEYEEEIVEVAMSSDCGDQVVYVPGLWSARINGQPVPIEQFVERFLTEFGPIQV